MAVDARRAVRKYPAGRLDTGCVILRAMNPTQDPAPELRRVTTLYLEDEDRLRLSGEAGDGRVLNLWLTRRLAVPLVAHLCHVLSQAANAGLSDDALQTMAQQAALARLEPQAPVASGPAVAPADGMQGSGRAGECASPDGAGHLVRSIDVRRGEAGITLVFREQEGGEAIALLPLATQALRQWLAIVAAQCERAGWQPDSWPAWLREASRPETGTGRQLH